MFSCITLFLFVDLRINGLNAISEQFEQFAITVTLEWIQENSLYCYNIGVIPPLQLHFNGATSVSVNMSYNVPYNLSILVAHDIVCIENPVIIFTQHFYYSEYYSYCITYHDYQCGFRTKKLILIAYCHDPAHLIEDPMEVFGYMNPAIPGSSVTFGCSSTEYSLVGSNTSICMDSGDWEPDPRKEIKCKGVSNCNNVLCITLIFKLSMIII